MTTMPERLLRPHALGADRVRLDLFWLLTLGLVLMGAGLGLRDPWPADEPRFALIARDMVATGQWLIPQVGGDIYADKPPLFFWIVGALYWLTGSLRVAILLPGLLAGLGVTALVYDLARRLWNRETALAAGLGLLATIQFVWQARQGQIDATLCFFTTLGLYGLLRHLLLGPAWGWYVIGWAAAGLGVITKGVGFLPILVLIPYALARKLNWTDPSGPPGGARWLLGPLAMIAAVSVWLAPMLIAAASDPHIAAYRDEILFSQTIDRYADAWHHKEPFWYFILQVIPVLWLPLVALIPWIWGYWRASWRSRDLRVLLPLSWVVLVVLFFSFSAGKRGVYVLPAAPAFVLACAPALRELAYRRGPRNTVFAIACAIAAITLAGAFYALFDAQQRERLILEYGIDVVGPLFAIGGSSALICALARPRRGFIAYGGVLAAILLVVSFWVNPVIDESRSGAEFMRKVEQLAAGSGELALVGAKEQYLLQSSRPTVNFGHARWRERDQEADDAAAWLAQDPRRMLLVDANARNRCFSNAAARDAGSANRTHWYLVTGEANPECAARGSLSAARWYAPPPSSKALHDRM